MILIANLLTWIDVKLFTASLHLLLWRKVRSLSPQGFIHGYRLCCAACAQRRWEEDRAERQTRDVAAPEFSRLANIVNSSPIMKCCYCQRIVITRCMEKKELTDQETLLQKDFIFYVLAIGSMWIFSRWLEA